MAEEEESNSLEHTSTWIVAVVCFVIVLISLAAERGLHRLGKCLKRKGQESLFEALQKIKAELMLLGFISLLLTVFQGFISEMCVPKYLTSIMLPCKKESNDHESNTHGKYAFQSSWSKRRLLAEGGNLCAKKDKAQFMSLEALHQLHIFIFVLAVVYVFFSAATMILGGLKVQRWKHWEDSLRREISKTRPDSGQDSTRFLQILSLHRFQFIKQRRGHSAVVGIMVSSHLLARTSKCESYGLSGLGVIWSLFVYLVRTSIPQDVTYYYTSFFKQFYGSVTKFDYITLRHGFIMTHCPKTLSYDFHKYMLRTLEYDFKKVVGISWYLWAFVVLFLLLNLKGWHAYFWLSFLPLILLLIVGTKLEHIIICLAGEIEEKDKENNQIQINPEDADEKRYCVTPSDKHFWFGRPSIFLYLIHFILFQNSFEVAFFLWVLFTYGIHSCILDRVGFIVPRLLIGEGVGEFPIDSIATFKEVTGNCCAEPYNGVVVQVLCSYSTLPLYTIVTQMGSAFKHGIFEPGIHESLESWFRDARGHRESSNPKRIEMQNMAPELREISAADESLCAVEGFAAPQMAGHCRSS